MKFDRNILEKLVETNAEAYSLLHYQYTNLESRYAKMENKHRETVRRIRESGLVDAEVFNEVKSAYSQAVMLLAQAQEEMENLRNAKDEAQKVQQNMDIIDGDNTPNY